MADTNVKQEMEQQSQQVDVVDLSQADTTSGTTEQGEKYENPEKRAARERLERRNQLLADIRALTSKYGVHEVFEEISDRHTELKDREDETRRLNWLKEQVQEMLEEIEMSLDEVEGAPAQEVCGHDARFVDDLAALSENLEKRIRRDNEYDF